MKKITFALMLLSQSAFANVFALQHVLNDDKLLEEMNDRLITNISIEERSQATTLFYKFRFQTVKRFSDDDNSHPCTTTVTYEVIGGARSTIVSEPVIGTICAE